MAAGQAGCSVLEGTGFVRWREYQWCKQKYVDRKGVPQEKRIQVFQERTGTRQEFLATFKRKLVEWLPHRMHLEWDSIWQSKRLPSVSAPSVQSEVVEPVTETCSAKIRNMPIGEVEVRIGILLRFSCVCVCVCVCVWERVSASSSGCCFTLVLCACACGLQILSRTRK